MVEFSNVKLFSATNDLLATAMKEYARNCRLEAVRDSKAFSTHSKDEMEVAINKAFSDALTKQVGYGSEKFGSGNTAVKKYSQSGIVKEFANSIRDDLLDMILPETLLTSSLPYFCDTKFADLGDTIKFNIENNALFTVSKAGYRMRNTNLQKLYRTTITMVGTNHEVTVGSDLFEILIGQAFIAKDVMKAALSMQTQMLFDAYGAFNTQMGALTGKLNVTNYSEGAAINLAQTVTAYNQGKKAVFVGTRKALKNLLPSNTNYRYMLDSDYVKIGHILTFNDFDVLPMEQVADPYKTTPYSLKLDDTKIYVVSPAAQKIVQLGVFGGTYSHTDAIYDNANKLQMSTMEKAWDVTVATNAIAGVITNFG